MGLIIDKDSLELTIKFDTNEREYRQARWDFIINKKIITFNNNNNN